jgi:hypothetical protein
MPRLEYGGFAVDLSSANRLLPHLSPDESVRSQRE